ncbi:MAG: UDP-N-acetylmuramoyl-L-alanyl-D-glutamate--2,6-diaminopimelate ligase [Ignavibacteriales bacterium]
MKLSEILNNVDVIQVVGNAELRDVKGVSNNSLEIKDDWIFVAIKGTKLDGHNFILEAINKNVAAVIIEENKFDDEIFIHSNCVKILVKDSRKALAQVSKKFWSDPSSELQLVGITGTKGKTTTSFLIKNILDSLGDSCGMLGTISNYIGKTEYQAKLTTPESHSINSFLRKMIDAGCAACSMEVSSHSLELHRVDGLNFKFAVFTNITSDHFDFHKNFKSYLKAKKKLFDMLSEESIIIYNADDPNSNELIKDSVAVKYSFGQKTNSDFKIVDIKYDLNGTTFTLTHKEFCESFFTSLIGKFNAYNAAAAIAVAFLMGKNISEIKNALAIAEQVPGRFEIISNKMKKVIVDYSHTTDSLKQALEAVHHLVTNEKIYTVFGCGGNRDKLKRPEMGKVATELSDFVYITSDNPRDEKPADIINDIISGIEKSNYKIIEKREDAIKEAILNSEKNAVVLIAGKGHENYQEISGVRKYFSDKDTAMKYLELC